MYVAADGVDVPTNGCIYSLYTARNWHPAAMLGVKDAEKGAKGKGAGKGKKGSSASLSNAT